MQPAISGFSTISGIIGSILLTPWFWSFLGPIARGWLHGHYTAQTVSWLEMAVLGLVYVLVFWAINFLIHLAMTLFLYGRMG